MQEKIKRKCPVCGSVYFADPTRLKWGRQTTCSRKCSYERRGTKLKNSVELVCALCETKFTRAPSCIKGKHGSQFCSSACHYAGRSLGLSKRVVTNPYRYTVEGMTKLRKAGAYAYASGNGLPYPKTELHVANRLCAIGISFIHQHVFEYATGAFVVDFYFPDRALVIELDTITAHRPYRDKDAKRDAMLQSYGISVIRIEDNGVLQDVARAVLLALAE